MRKVIAILMMIVIVGGYYFWSINRDVLSEEEAYQAHQDGMAYLAEIESRLTVGYPETSIAVMELYNELLEYQYGKNVQLETIPESVKIMRLLYTAELLHSNDYEQQAMIEEQAVERLTRSGVYMVSSAIGDVEMLDEAMVEIDVLHYMNGTDNIERTYYLMKENGEWKMHTWVN